MLEEPGSLNSYNVQQLQYALSDPKRGDIFSNLDEDQHHSQAIFVYGDRRMSTSAISTADTSDSSVSRGEKRALTPQPGELENEPNQKRSRVDDGALLHDQEQQQTQKAPHLPNILTTFDRRNSLPNNAHTISRTRSAGYNPTGLSGYTFPPTSDASEVDSGYPQSSAGLSSGFPSSFPNTGDGSWTSAGGADLYDHHPRPSSTPGSAAGGYLPPNLAQPPSMRHASFSAAEHSLMGRGMNQQRISGHHSPAPPRTSFSAKEEWTFKFPNEDFAHRDSGGGAPPIMSPSLDSHHHHHSHDGGRVNRSPTDRMGPSSIGRVTRSRSSNAGLDEHQQEQQHQHQQQQQMLPQSIIASTSSLSGAVIPPGQPGGLPAQRKRGKLPKETTDFLKSWLHRHSEHPYPSEEEKKQLCHATGLSMSQVSNWMINARRRILAPAQRAASGPTTTAPFPSGGGGARHDSRSNSLHDVRGSARPYPAPGQHQASRSPGSMYDGRSNSMLDPRIGNGGSAGGYSGGGLRGIPMMEGRRASMPSDPLQLYPAMSLQPIPGVTNGLGGPGYPSSNGNSYPSPRENYSTSSRGEYRVGIPPLPRSSGGWSDHSAGNGTYSPGYNGGGGDQYFGDGGSSGGGTRSSPHHSNHGTPQ